MNIDAFKDPSFLAQDDATKQRVLANFFASSTANDSEFASLDPARKERIKNNFISTSLGALTQSSQPQSPKPQSAWRVDPKEGEDYAEPKFNTTAVATAPELFKAAPDKVKAKAAAGVADAAIKKKWEDRAPIIGKPLATANEFLNRAGLAVETTFGSVANTLGDTFSGSLTPSASTISDSAKKVGITDETALKKLETLSKGAEQNFTDEELIKVKKLSDPSRTSIVSSLMGEKSSYTPEAMQRYVDGLDKALGDKYDVGANIGEKGELIPVAKLKGAGDEGWMELKGDGIWQDLKTGVLLYIIIVFLHSEAFICPRSSFMCAISSLSSVLRETPLYLFVTLQTSEIVAEFLMILAI